MLPAMVVTNDIADLNTGLKRKKQQHLNSGFIVIHRVLFSATSQAQFHTYRPELHNYY